MSAPLTTNAVNDAERSDSAPVRQHPHGVGRGRPPRAVVVGRMERREAGLAQHQVRARQHVGVCVDVGNCTSLFGLSATVPKSVWRML